MRKDYEKETDILKWFGFLTFVFLMGVIHSCMSEKTKDSCKQICEGRGLEMDEMKNKFWFVECSCANKSKKVYQFVP
jgi:hypothetical protein